LPVSRTQFSIEQIYKASSSKEIYIYAQEWLDIQLNCDTSSGTPQRLIALNHAAPAVSNPALPAEPDCGWILSHPIWNTFPSINCWLWLTARLLP